MNVICLEDEALYELVFKVTENIKDRLGVKEDKWILPEEAMRGWALIAKQHCRNIEMKVG